MSVQRAYWWTFLLYEDSTPDNWLDVLDKSGAQIAYILHDSDVWDKDVIDGESIKHEKGSPKKAHYHVLLRWDNAKSWKQMYNYFNCLGTSHFEVVKTPKHAFMYLTHETEDSRKKKKHLYDVKSIEFLNSSLENFESFARVSGRSTDTGNLVEIFEYLRDNEIIEMADFINDCLRDGRLDLIETASGRQGYIIQSYITSLRNKMHEMARQKEMLKND